LRLSETALHQHGIQISSLGTASGTLYDSNGAQVGTVNTAQNGWLSLNGLPAGSYTLEVFSPTSNQLEYNVTIHAPEAPVTSDLIPRLLGDLTPGVASSSGHEFFSAGDYTYFFTYDESYSTTTLWSHRRHTQSPQPIATIPAAVDNAIETSTGQLAFAASNGNYHQLWMSDGTPQGTYCTWDFVLAELAAAPESPNLSTLAELNGQLLGFMPIADTNNSTA
jgi:ELWxxDGT repeat protein